MKLIDKDVVIDLDAFQPLLRITVDVPLEVVFNDSPNETSFTAVGKQFMQLATQALSEYEQAVNALED